MVKGLYIMDPLFFCKVYNDENRKLIEQYADIYAPPQGCDDVLASPEILKDAEVLFFGWRSPQLNAEFLEAASSLKAVFYGAGSVKKIVTPEFWKKGILLTSAYEANSVPVAEFTLSQILFSLKRGWQQMDYFHKNQTFHRMEVPGAYKSCVGLISLGMVARNVIKLLRSFDIEILAYDPFVSEKEAVQLGVRLTSLDNLFRESDVVSLHTPWLKETEGMITGDLFRLMKKDSTFINTARGAVVNENEMIQVLSERKDIMALLDVTHPEPPAKGSPLYTMENVRLTPHIAGSMSAECGRMGHYMYEEFRRYLNSEPLKWEITEELAVRLA